MATGRPKRAKAKEKKGPRGRPRRDITDAEIEEARKLAELGCTQKAIASHLGWPLRTFQKRAAEDERLGAALASGLSAAEKMCAGVLLNAVRGGNWRAALAFLERRCGWTTRAWEADNAPQDGGMSYAELAAAAQAEMQARHQSCTGDARSKPI